MKNYKTGLIIFLFLATIISLFPPFEWGNENIKKYDFLFSSNKKYFPIGSYNYEQKLYSGEKIGIDTSDIISKDIVTGIDTFFINKYKVKKSFPLKKDNIGRDSNPNRKGGKNYDFSFTNIDWGSIWEKEYNEIKQRTGNADTIQHYKIYKLVKPHWYLSHRKLILNELILEYLLAGFIASFVQVIVVFAKRKRDK